MNKETRYRKVIYSNGHVYDLINFLKFYNNTTLLKSFTKNEGHCDDLISYLYIFLIS